MIRRISHTSQALVDELKDIVLDRLGAISYIFNTNGWIKAWDVLDYSEFVEAQGHDFW